MNNSYNRRRFLGKLTFGLGITALGTSGISSLFACSGSTNEKRTQQAGEQKAQDKLGIALVGLGQYSEGELAPALQETQHCYLAGIVTGTPDKADKWKKKYNIPDKNIYNYQNFDTIKDNPDIDVVYVVLPNALHAEYTIRAAKAGKHVICEKPMAITVEECDRMIAACKEVGKMLSIGYRLHFEPHNKEMMRLGQEKVFGAIKKLRADNGTGSTEGWRLDKELAGGGPLMEVGIYCVQGVRYTTGMEPIAVRAKEMPKTKPELFKEVEEALSWQMEFPGNIIAECKTSYSEDMNLLRADAEKGWFELSPAYPYSGIKGETSKGKMEFEQVNQQARQMDDFAKAVKENRATPVPGEMGRQDVKILQAIYQAMRTGQRVEIS
ncbi:Gfo/Idh/MocA family protein [Desertivirga brevis]|uniref:Gfo/Idh/MocA family protein n=1 Tax=Desertivirga brevis TaxID=2810310 RepID=UPI001A968917|nr:Gfo/Idh/MocA family oxidoreductase [Pedobacter sp. SYSU D00873]